MSAPNPGLHTSRPPVIDQAAEFSLLDLVNVMLMHRRLMVGLPLVAAALVTAILLLLPRSFTSSASFMPQGSKANVSHLAGLAAQFGVALPTSDPGEAPEFYADLLTTRPILDAVLDTTYTFQVGDRRYHGALADLLDVRGATEEERRFAAMRKLKKQISVKTEPEIGLVRFSVYTPWAPLSQQVADRMLILISDFNLKRRQSQAAAERRFVESRLAASKDELRTAERALQAFLERNRDFRNSPLLTFEQNRLQQEVGMRQTVYTSLAQSFENARIDEVRNTPVITVVEPPDQPVKPDRRDLILRALLALVVGAFLALAVAFSRELFLKTREEDPEHFSRFIALRREALQGLRRPWSGLRRVLGQRS